MSSDWRETVSAHCPHTAGLTWILSVGVYGSAPLWGRIVDTRGPRGLFITGFFALLIGYVGIRHYYDRGLVDGSSTLSTFSIVLLAIFSFCTGIGGNAGLASAMNSTAKSWPDKMVRSLSFRQPQLKRRMQRATVNGVVISGFGLSAFLFSTIAHVAFPGNTSDFLLILAVGTALPMVLGFFLVRPIPLPGIATEETLVPTEPSPSAVVAFPALFRVSSRAPLLSHHPARHHLDPDEDTLESEELIPEYTAGVHHGAEVSDYYAPTNMGSVALSPTRSHGRSSSSGALSSRRPSARSYEVPLVDPEPPNVHGKGLFMHFDFWVLFSITALRKCYNHAVSTGLTDLSRGDRPDV